MSINSERLRQELEASKDQYWNSNTRHNALVRVLAANGENYAVECGGHVYVVPKNNITLEKKKFFTTAPKPEETYWITLTTEEYDYFALSSRKADDTDVWSGVIQNLLSRRHAGDYTEEWFAVSAPAANRLLAMYLYATYKNDKSLNEMIPLSTPYKQVVHQLWDEKLRRDGIVPK